MATLISSPFLNFKTLIPSSPISNPKSPFFPSALRPKTIVSSPLSFKNHPPMKLSSRWTVRAMAVNNNSSNVPRETILLPGCDNNHWPAPTREQMIETCPNTLATVVGRNIKKVGKKEHHLWMRRYSAGSGLKALNLVQIVSKLPNEKEAVYGALDKWSAWETEFPVIAAAKALEILRRRNQWLRIIQVTKWLLSKGQVLTMATYDTLLLALDMDQRVGEAETIWNVILQTHTRSVSKRLFSRMISLYDHHHIPEKIVEVFADMEELGVKPDEDTVRRIARAFEKLGQVENQKLLLQRYQNKWKYLRFNGERVRVRNPEYPNV